MKAGQKSFGSSIAGQVRSARRPPELVMREVGVVGDAHGIGD